MLDPKRRAKKEPEKPIKKVLSKRDYICDFCMKKVAVGKKVYSNATLEKHGMKFKGHKLCLNMAVKEIDGTRDVKILDKYRLKK